LSLGAASVAPILCDSAIGLSLQHTPNLLDILRPDCLRDRFFIGAISGEVSNSHHLSRRQYIRSAGENFQIELVALPKLRQQKVGGSCIAVAHVQSRSLGWICGGGFAIRFSQPSAC